MMIYETSWIGWPDARDAREGLPSVGRFIEHAQDGRKGRLEELVSGIQAWTFQCVVRALLPGSYLEVAF